MPNTMTLIATSTVGAGGGTFSFTNIPQTFTDLLFTISVRCTASLLQTDLAGYINGAAYPDTLVTNAKRIYANPNNVYTDSPSTGFYTNLGLVPGANATANTFSNIQAYFPNYTSSNQKTVSVDHVMENNSTNSFMGFTTSIKNTSLPITSINIDAGTLVQYSTISLYGILKGSGGASVS